MKMECGNCQNYADSGRKTVIGKDRIARHCAYSKDYVELDTVKENCKGYTPRTFIWCRKLGQYKPECSCDRARKDPEYPLHEECSRCRQGNLNISGKRFYGFLKSKEEKSEKKGLAKFKPAQQ